MDRVLILNKRNTYNTKALFLNIAGTNFIEHKYEISQVDAFINNNIIPKELILELPI
jgi:hypothetical protein